MNTPKKKLVVTQPKGSVLLKEPPLSPTMEDQKDNIILKLSSGTHLTLEDDDLRTVEGSEWAFVKYKSGKKQELGWVVVGDIALDEVIAMFADKKFIVSASDGTDLCIEPNGNSKTEDEMDNVIARLPVGTQVIWASFDFRFIDESAWYFVSHKIRNKTRFGWVIAGDLTYTGLLVGNSPSGNISSSYTFDFDKKSRTISETNLKTAITNNKLFTQKMTDTDVEIELNAAFQNYKKYWTTRENLKNITLNPSVT